VAVFVTPASEYPLSYFTSQQGIKWHSAVHFWHILRNGKSVKCFYYLCLVWLAGLYLYFKCRSPCLL